MPVVDQTERADRAELIEGLRHMVHAARREFPKVGTLRAPTPWDRRHQSINELLTNLELLGWDDGKRTAPDA
jgi:hypothetical protein